METVYFPWLAAQWIGTTIFYPADALMHFVVGASASGSLNRQLCSYIGNWIASLFFLLFFLQWATTNAHSVTWPVPHHRHCEIILNSVTVTRSRTPVNVVNTGAKSSAAQKTHQHKRLALHYPFQPFLCFPPRCKNLIDLRKHLDTHSSEPTFHCDITGCNFTSRALSTMKLHHKREHEVKSRRK